MLYPLVYAPRLQQMTDVLKMEPNSDTVTNETSCHSGFNFTEIEQKWKWTVKMGCNSFYHASRFSTGNNKRTSADMVLSQFYPTPIVATYFLQVHLAVFIPASQQSSNKLPHENSTFISSLYPELCVAHQNIIHFNTWLHISLRLCLYLMSQYFPQYTVSNM